MTQRDLQTRDVSGSVVKIEFRDGGDVPDSTVNQFIQEHFTESKLIFSEGLIPRSKAKKLCKNNPYYVASGRKYGHCSNYNAGSRISKDGSVTAIAALRLCSRDPCPNRESRVNQFPYCSRCRTVYCSVECQKEDWPQHREYCLSKNGFLSLLSYYYDKLGCSELPIEDAVRILTQKNNEGVFDIFYRNRPHVTVNEVSYSIHGFVIVKYPDLDFLRNYRCQDECLEHLRINAIEMRSSEESMTNNT